MTLIVLVRLLVGLSRPRPDGRPLTFADLTPLLIAAIIGGSLLALTRLLPSVDPLFSFPGIVPELIALVVGVPLLLVVGAGRHRP